MKKTQLTHLQHEAQKISLTFREREAMHARLMERVHGSSVASPVRSQPGLYYFFSPQFAMPMAGLLVVLIVGSSTAYAAKGSLPGDALYTVKTKISEPLQGVFAFSTEDKIKFHTDIAQVRIEEAEVLASQNRLDEDKTKEIESSLDAHLAERSSLATSLDEKHSNEGTALARLNTTIVAHGDILEALGAESSSSTTRQNSNTLAMKVRSGSNWGSGSGTIAMAKSAASMAPQASGTNEAVTLSLSMAQDVSVEATSANEAPTSSSNSEHDNKNKDKDSKAKSAALSLGKKATSTLESLKAKVKLMKEVDENTQAKLDARFGKIEALIKEGNTSLAHGDYSDAKDEFNEALDRETTLSAFIAAGVQFDGGILGNLLGHDSRWGED
jgi:hypothetical protein